MKAKYSDAYNNSAIKWRCDLDRSIIIENMNDRKWEEAENPMDFNFGWIQVHLIRKLFHPSIKQKLNDKQLVNHFPNHWELTRKDLMAKNLKKLKKDQGTDIVTLANGRRVELSIQFLPETYILPLEHQLFLEAFIKSPTKNWIFKPAGKSQGTGIQIINKIA